MTRKGKLAAWAGVLGVAGFVLGLWAKVAYGKAEIVGYYSAGLGGSSIGSSETAGAVAGMKAALLPGGAAALLILAAVALAIVAAVIKPDVPANQPTS